MKKLVLLALFAFATIASAQVYQDGAVNLNFTGRLNAAKGVAINSNATVDLNSVAGNLVHIVGTTTITSFGTASQAGIARRVIFDSATPLTYNATSLVIPGSLSIVTAAGDAAEIVADTTANWIIVSYKRRASAP